MSTDQRAGVHYLEDLNAGMVFTTNARTITEADVVAFGGLSGDFNRIHTDAEFAATTQYGQRVVYGLLVMAIATGLLDRLGTFSGSAVAMLGIREWSFEAPVFIGDTVSLTLTIESVRETSDGRRGIVQRHFDVINQRAEIVQRGRIDVMVRRRPGEAAPPSGA